MNQYYRTGINTIVGQLTLIGSDKGLYAVLWPTDTDRIKLPKILTDDAQYPLFLETEKQLQEYFIGKRKEFTIPLDFDYGTSFQQAIWKGLRSIPYGEVRSYTQQAEALGIPQAVRAIGSANGKNPLSIIVPCHRVITSSGQLGGFAGGLAIKQQLIDLEKKNAR